MNKLYSISVFLKSYKIFKYNTDENTLNILEFAGCAASTASIDRTPLLYSYIYYKYIFASSIVLLH